MRPLGGVVWTGALLLLTGAQTVEAAWNNVFQVCCFGCRSRPSYSSNYGPVYTAPSYYTPSVAVADAGCNPCPAPCPPQQVCTTRYVQRCYYQPVTTYQTRSYYEAVTTYQTSYYYEPVTSYRYSCYYDPCTCSYQQVACPVTSYCLRAQSCPTTSWVQRCTQVPVTSYQQSYYYEPVTTCCTTTSYTPPPASPASPPCCDSPATATPTYPPPAVKEQPPASAPTSPPPPGVKDYPSGEGNPRNYDRQYPIPQSTNPPPASSNVYRQAPPRLPPMQGVPALPPPRVRLDRVVSAPSAEIQGQVVRADHSARGGARLVFVGLDQRDAHQAITADQSGQFRVTLASGGWFVYVQNADGKSVFHSQIEVRENEARKVTLVSQH